MRRIAVNAGQDGSVIVQEVRTLPAGQGYDAARDDFSNMLERGIIDPLKVTRPHSRTPSASPVWS